ncbi:MAG: hypothetical protein WC702_00020 [Patescibacteria group bacterium]|jgi:hypothetical protein
MKKIFFVIFFLSFFLFTATARAAIFSIESPVTDLPLNQKITVKFYLDAQNETINAVEGKLNIPDTLQVVGISNGGSIINFWVEEQASVSDNSLAFSGIIPGGFYGKHGLLFSIDFLTTEEGSPKLSFSESTALLNDGAGTAAQTSTNDLTFNISSDITGVSGLEESVVDTTPPETFVPVVGQDVSLFDNQWFLVFSTQDKESGIAYYEVQETKSSKPGETWIRAESPYLLLDQKLNSHIFVKAVDNFGNERLIKTAGYPPLWYQNSVILVIISVGLLLALVLIIGIWRKKLKKYPLR